MIDELCKEKILSSSNQFDASGSLAGYIYQCRLALLLGLQAVKKKPNGQISIEKFDDIAFDNDDHAECLVQAKHHISSKELTDSSVDVWKTLRIWIEDFKSGVITNADTRRLLITTAVAPDGSAISKLRPETNASERQEALSGLRAIATSSVNQATKVGRELFLSLTDEEAALLLKSIHVLDAAPNLPDVLDDIEGELRILAPSHSDKVTEMLEGWWLKVVAKRLVGDEKTQIPLQDILRKANEIGGMFRPDGLPVSAPDELGDKTYDPSDEAEVYVRQMRLVQLPDTTIRNGVRDFYRAKAQRSKWAREGLLLDGEAAKYDARLQDQWERRFEAVCSEAADSDDDGKRKVGRGVYHWANQQQVGFRNVVESWITAGSFQGLSDRLKVGWHPHFTDHLGNGGDNGEP
jgi:hypothetical protein